MRSSRKNKFRLLQFPAADVGAIHFKLTTFSYFFSEKKIESNLEGARAVCSNWGVASAKSFSATWSCSGGRGQHFDSFHSLISLKRLRPAHAKTNNWKQRRHADTRTTNSAISGYYWIFFLRSTRLDVQHIGTLCMSESGPCGALNEATSGGRAAAIICKMSLLVCSFFSLRLQGWTR